MQSEMKEMIKNPKLSNGDELYVHDSLLDYNGNLPLRASTGSWKAAVFFIAIEFSERLSHISIAANLITYLTTVMHQDLETAVNSVNLWTGVSLVTPILGGFLGDAYIGRFRITLFFAILYIMGLCLLIMTQYIPSLKPCNSKNLTSCQSASEIHKAVFFTAAYLLSLATGGVKPCLEAFGANQFDDNHSEERKKKMSYFNWWNVAVNAGGLLGVTVIVYIQDNIGWGVAFVVTASTMALTVMTFIFGRTFYRYTTVKGSPLTPLFRVFVAALSKRSLPYPSDPALLYEIPASDKRQGRVLYHTNRLRFLDKAAIVEEQERSGPWRLATVTQVEELKLILHLIPIWLTCLVFGLGLSQIATFFTKQGSAMDRKLSNNFDIPPASLMFFIFVTTMVMVPIYDKLLIPYLRRVTRGERGINILNRIAIGMVLLIIAMVVSALVERKRLIALQNGIILSVFWLVPQALIIGIGDAFSIVGLQEFFYEQVPDSMRSIGMALCLSVIGVGVFLSNLLIIIVNAVTGMNGGKTWIGKDVNHSRLDYFYWLLAVIIVVNMCVFMVLVKGYSYKNVQRNVDRGESNNEDNKGVEHSGV